MIISQVSYRTNGPLVSKVYLIRVLSFIEDLRFNVRGEHVPGCRGSGTWWLPAGGIPASQGTFSSFSYRHSTIPLILKSEISTF